MRGRDDSSKQEVDGRMITRALDNNSDATFGQGRENFLSDQNAIALNIKTRLYSLLRDCFFDIQAGVDWMRFMSVPTKAQEIQLSVRAIVLQSYGVVKVNNIFVSVVDRRILISINIDTIFTNSYTYDLEYVPVS